MTKWGEMLGTVIDAFCSKMRPVVLRRKQRRSQEVGRGGTDFNLLMHDSIKPPVWSRSFVAKFL